MHDYTVVFARSARKELERLPSSVAQRIISAIEQLRENPRPAGVRKLSGTGENLWRLRSGDYRVIYPSTIGITSSMFKSSVTGVRLTVDSG